MTRDEAIATADRKLEQLVSQYEANPLRTPTPYDFWNLVHIVGVVLSQFPRQSVHAAPSDN